MAPIGKRYRDKNSSGFYFHEKGEKFKIPLTTKVSGKKYSEKSISLTKSNAEKRARSIRNSGKNAVIKKRTKNGKTVYVVYTR